MLPACDRNLKLHLRRSNYVAHTLGHAVRWVDKYFPHDIQDILIAVNQKEGVKENDVQVDVGDDDDTDIEIKNFS